MGGRTLSASSDRTNSHRSSMVVPSTSSAVPKTSSALKQPKKALAAALNLSRNNSQAEITPQEISLPHDPFVNGQALEVFLYKQGEECPLCLMYYPPYLNRTRCCCQLICSECFVQIKRPDPHFPEHHTDGANAEESRSNPEGQNERLIMEPAKCPYCTQSEFGVTYEAPPFRRGLAYAVPPSSLGAMSTARSSSSSINSSLSPTAASPSQANRKRAQSLSANAPNVVTADRIRPDWTGKLATALAHQRRRAAAADALHHAAFVMGNQESRTFFGRSSRFSRRAGGGARGTESPGSSATPQEGADETPNTGAAPSAARSGGRERIDAAHLESLMMAEAIRLSLADEEERRKKADKEARKEAKKREKEERKAAKKKGEVYSGGSASGSSLSLGLGRRRGDSSGTGSLRVDASVAAATVATGGSAPSSPTDKGKGVERGTTDETPATTSASSSALPIPTPQVLRGSSHLRQMSNASSISSSGIDSMPGSYTGKSRNAEDPYGSALSLGQSEQGESAGPEPLFNFRSLAEVVGVSIDGESSQADDNASSSHEVKLEQSDEAEGEHIEHAVESSQSSIKEAETSNDTASKIKPIQVTEYAQTSQAGAPPDVVITPNTPAPLEDGDESKQLGHFDTRERSHEVTQ